MSDGATRNGNSRNAAGRVERGEWAPSKIRIYGSWLDLDNGTTNEIAFDPDDIGLSGTITEKGGGSIRGTFLPEGTPYCGEWISKKPEEGETTTEGCFTPDIEVNGVWNDINGNQISGLWVADGTPIAGKSRAADTPSYIASNYGRWTVLYSLVIGEYTAENQ
jgi:hypothetical protein